jgi:hypothetical protein
VTHVFDAAGHEEVCELCDGHLLEHLDGRPRSYAKDKFTTQPVHHCEVQWFNFLCEEQKTAPAREAKDCQGKQKTAPAREATDSLGRKAKQCTGRESNPGLYRGRVLFYH